jgi:hypothetical protein
MLHFAATIQCPLCRYVFSLRVTASDKSDADTILTEQRIHVAQCPNHGGTFRVRLPHSAFRPVEPPEPEAPPAIEPTVAKRWWQFWK